MKNPCMGCPKAGCGAYHDKCPEYQEYRHGKEKEYKQKLVYNDYRYYKDDSYHRAKKSSH